MLSWEFGPVWNAVKQRSGNLYDIAFNPAGELFVSMGTEGNVWRVSPDPERPFYGNDQTGRTTTAIPYLEMTKLAGKKTSCNNIFVDDTGYLYISTRNNDTGQGNLSGTIYRVKTGS